MCLLCSGGRKNTLGLRFEFGKLLIIDHNSSNLLNARDYVAILSAWVISFNPHDVSGCEDLGCSYVKSLTQIPLKSEWLNLQLIPVNQHIVFLRAGSRLKSWTAQTGRHQL